MADIHSFSEPLVLMLGGRDKNLPWQELADLIHQRVDHVVVFGEASEKILKALGPLEAGKRPYTIDRCLGLQEAIHAAAAVTQPGDVVLLSPGGTSFDEFSDFEQRGERFRLWVNQLSNNPITARVARQAPHALRMGFDVPLLLAVITLLIFGLLMVYSASWKFAMDQGHTPGYLVSRQMGFAVLGSLFALVAWRVDYRRYQKWAFLLLLLCLGALFATLVVNRNNPDPGRTLVSQSVQPSELAKLVMIIYLSVWLTSKKDKLNQIGFGLAPMIVIIGTTCGFIMLQTDISAAATIYILGALLFFLAKADVRQVFLVILMAAVLGFAVVNVTSTGRDRCHEIHQRFYRPG